MDYQAQSPDEAALTSAARNFGFVFKVIMDFSLDVARRKFIFVGTVTMFPAFYAFSLLNKFRLFDEC